MGEIAGREVALRVGPAKQEIAELSMPFSPSRSRRGADRPVGEDVNEFDLNIALKRLAFQLISI